MNRLAPAPFSTLDANRICIIKPSSLGDVVQALPILSALRTRFPHAHIAWLVNRSYASLLRPIRMLDEVIEFDRERFREGGLVALKGYFDFLADLADRKFELTIDLQGLLRSGSMSWATRAPKRFGLASAREGASFFYTYVVDDLPVEQGAVQRYWKLASAFGVGHLPKEFPLDLTAVERSWASEQLKRLRRPIVAINAGARWETKRWPAERFAEVARRAGSATVASYVLVGGPGEEPIAEEVRQGLPADAVNLCGKTSLRHLAAILEQCDLVLTNDSGPMHLAAAVGTRTVSIFTCTSPERAGPFGWGHRIVQTNVPCKASYIKQCDRMDCMKDVTVDSVLPVLTDAIHCLPSRDAACSAVGQRRVA
ncbi:MAG: lipopolysaccharide heptosyltransferase II [Planctomycetota bacterium]